MDEFIPGMQLSQMFYEEIVRPILERAFPGLPYAAGLIDGGSEVLGFDDEMSVDHNWGPRLMLFLSQQDHPLFTDQVHQLLASSLPYEFKGYLTNFSTPLPEDVGVRVLQAIQEGPVNHRISIQTVRDFFTNYLGFDISQALEPADWLTFSQQRLRTITAGSVFHDDLDLNAVRDRFTYYPRDVWLYMLAAGWTRIGQEEHLMGRAGMVGDEVGSALIAARLVRDIMQLCFLMEKTYAPYSKWFGSAFRQLSAAETLWPVLQSIQHARTWWTRQNHLVQAYKVIAARHNALQLTRPFPEQASSFHGRPFQVIASHGFAGTLLEQVQDPIVKQIAQRPLIGGIDLFSDNTDLLSNPSWRPQLRKLYE